jgi:hypothetical protein
MKPSTTWRSATLLGSVVVMAVASLLAHAAGAAEGEGVGEAAEHASSITPLFVGPLGALVLLGLVRLVRRRSLGPAWFVILPPLAFGLQELAERGLDSHMIEPSALVAALVQVPFALLAYALARVLRAAFVQVARFLTAPRSLPRVRTAAMSWPRSTRSVALVPVLAGNNRGRAPPRLR